MENNYLNNDNKPPKGRRVLQNIHNDNDYVQPCNSSNSVIVITSVMTQHPNGSDSIE